MAFVLWGWGGKQSVQDTHLSEPAFVPFNLLFEFQLLVIDGQQWNSVQHIGLW